MKGIGIFIIFLGLVGLQSGFSFGSLGTLLLGLFMVGVEWWIQLFGQTIRYIHKDSK